jgi:hypothetical protein
VAASTVDCRAQGARAVGASRSPVFLRLSRAAVQAAIPAPIALKKTRLAPEMTEARTVQIGGNPAAVRYASK